MTSSAPALCPGDLELLCTSSGSGVLTCDGAPMPLKAAKPLPASD